MKATSVRMLILGICCSAACPPTTGQGTWRSVPELAPREHTAMAYDPGRERIVLFGGYPRGPASMVFLDDTWEWDGRRWIAKRPHNRPSGRFGHAMAYDPVRKTVLLFGGAIMGPETFYNDLWEWDGQDWRQISTAVAPSPRFRAGVATDPVRGRVVLFGGLIGFRLLPAGKLFEDTWEWDGSRWAQQSPQHSPEPRSSHGMAYSPKTGNVVLYGGSNFGPELLATFEWDGIDWYRHPTRTEISPEHLPGSRPAAQLATHPLRGTVIMHGGHNNSRQKTDDTWEWNGVSWRRLANSTMPPTHVGPGLATDWRRNEIVMFGGFGERSQRPRDTWTFSARDDDWRKVDDWYYPGAAPMTHDPYHDEFVLTSLLAWAPPFAIETVILEDNRFERRASATTPPIRMSTYTIWHGGLRKVFMFGGGYAGQNDTWLWDGTTWTEHVSATPPPGGHQSIAYDSRRDRVVLLANSSCDTWEWDASGGWGLVQTTTKPSTRVYPGLHYDPRRGRTVLFGGLLGSNKLDDTWEYDGRDWQPTNPTSRPKGQGVMAYVEALGGVVMVTTASGKTETWLWNGNDWRLLQTNGLPANGVVFPLRTLAYDSNRQRLRLWLDKLGDSLWDLVVETLAVSQPYPKLGQTITFTLDLPGQPSAPWLLGFSKSNRPGIPLRPVPFLGTEMLPLAPDMLLDVSLQARMGGVLDPSGKGSIQVTVPNNPALEHFGFHAAALTLDTVAGNVGAITNRIELEIVR